MSFALMQSSTVRSLRNGSVRIAWAVAGADGTRELRLRWTEVGGPRFPPTRRGFGTRLVVDGLRQDLAGNVKIRLQSHRSSLRDRCATEYDQFRRSCVAHRRKCGTTNVTGSSLVGLRILVIEDESLITMLLKTRSPTSAVLLRRMRRDCRKLSKRRLLCFSILRSSILILTVRARLLSRRPSPNEKFHSFLPQATEKGSYQRGSKEFLYSTSRFKNPIWCALCMRPWRRRPSERRRFDGRM